MKTRLLLVCILLLPVSNWGTDLPEPEPKLPAHVVFRPTFLTRDYSFTSGTGFLTKKESGGSSFLVTVHHLFGPSGGLEQQFSGALIPALFLRAVGFSFDQDPLLLTTDEGVAVFDARVADKDGAEKDIALFRVRGWSANKSLTLKEEPPAIKEKAWIVLRDVRKNDLLFAEVMIAWQSPKEIRYLVQDPELNFAGASGAPVVNAAGEVVAMHTGIFTSKSGRIFGFGCPAAAILDALPED